MFQIKWIQGKVIQEEYLFSKHGDQERKIDNPTISEIKRLFVVVGF